MQRIILSCLSVALTLVLTATAVYAELIPISRDRDEDGLRDLDEQGVSITVPENWSGDLPGVPSTGSGYSIESGEQLLIRATGQVAVSATVQAGPEGTDFNPDFAPVIPTAPYLCLIARVGDQPWFPVGKSRLLEATATGEIQFTVNAVPGSFQNGAGTFSVLLGRNVGSEVDEPDTDGDGVRDGDDGAPLDPTETLDTDGDGLGNNVDPDDDGDGLFDSEESGLTWLVVPEGATATLATVPTGLIMQPNEFPRLTATGTLVDGVNLESSTPVGRVDLSTVGLALPAPDLPLYRLIGQIGGQTWVSVGLEGDLALGYPAAIPLVTGTHHLGDDVVSTWEVAAPEGLVFNVDFELDRRPDYPVVMRTAVWSTRESNLVYLNGTRVGRLPVNRTVEGVDTFMAAEIPLPTAYLQPGRNTIQIQAGPDDDWEDTTSVYDDFMFRNMLLDFAPSAYHFVETTAHHLGDEANLTSFEIPSAEGTEFERMFHLPAVPASGTARLYIDAFDVTTDRPPVPVEINGQVIGSLCQRAPEENNYWDQCVLEFDVGVLLPGYNRFRITSPRSPEYGDYDDFIFRFVTVQVTTEPVVPELVLAYNNRLGEFANNTGGYEVTIGWGIDTDPLDPDTDGDTMDDRYETIYGLNPLSPADVDGDLDLDTLTNIVEYGLQTRPDRLDTDQDRVSDPAEVAVGSDPLDPTDPLPLDYHYDGAINHLDIFKQAGEWQRSVAPLSYEVLMDMDGTGYIGPEDLLLFKENF